MLNVKFRLIAHEGKGLRDAPRILSKEFRTSLESVGKRLKASAETRMRRDRGDAIRSLKREVTGQGLDLKVLVYSTLLQAFIDAYGMRPGINVPYGVGSNLRHWVDRRIRVGPSRDVKGLNQPYAGAGPRRVFRGSTARRPVAKASRVTTGKRIKGTNRGAIKSRLGDRLAFLVARSIFLHGIKASNWNRKALEANRTRITRELNNAISRAVRKINRG